MKFTRSDSLHLPTDSSLEDIGMGEYRVSEDRLFTAGVASCIVMVGHNRDNSRGLLGHFNDLTSGKRFNSREAFMAAVNELPKLGRLASTDVWLGGGRPYMQHGRDTAVPDRSFALEVIKTVLPDARQLTVDWLPEKLTCALELHCSTGELLIEYADK